MKHHRPAAFTILALGAGGTAGLAGISGFLLVVFALSIRDNPSWAQGFLFLSLPLLGFAIANGIVAGGMWTLQRWALPAAVVLLSINAVALGASVVVAFLATDGEAGVDPFRIGGIVLSLSAIWYLTRRETRMLFT